jgi:hypothetical protein
MYAVLSGTKYGLKQTRGKFGLGAKMVMNFSAVCCMHDYASLLLPFGISYPANVDATSSLYLLFSSPSSCAGIYP